jgi:uncharacterized protein YerC
MSQISKKRLDKDVEREMFNQFWASLSKIDTPSAASEFFSDLLTKTEKYVLAKRFTCAILLVRGHSASEINKSIHLTYSTIGSVASWVKNARPQTKHILEKISKEKDWEKVFDRIDSLLDKLPPKYGTDWSRVGKEKYKSALQRSARSNLR